KEILQIDKYPADEDGLQTINLMKRSLKILNRITGKSAGSLGLHPAVYFYNERGKYSRFLFLGMTSLIADKIRNNDDGFFKGFIKARKALEQFLMDNKSLIGIALQNMSKTQRVLKMKELFDLLITSAVANHAVTPESAMEQIGIRGRIFDLKAAQGSPLFSDDTKTMAFVSAALSRALKCEICGGLLDPKKSVSYDHITPIRDGGTGELENA